MFVRVGDTFYEKSNILFVQNVSGPTQEVPGQPGAWEPAVLIRFSREYETVIYGDEAVRFMGWVIQETEVNTMTDRWDKTRVFSEAKIYLGATGEEPDDGPGQP